MVSCSLQSKNAEQDGVRRAVAAVASVASAEDADEGHLVVVEDQVVAVAALVVAVHLEDVVGASVEALVVGEDVEHRVASEAAEDEAGVASEAHNTT